MYILCVNVPVHVDADVDVDVCDSCMCIKRLSFIRRLQLDPSMRAAK